MKIEIEIDASGSDFKKNYHSALRRVLDKVAFELKYNKKEQYIAVMRESPEEMKSLIKDNFGQIIGSVTVKK